MTSPVQILYRCIISTALLWLPVSNALAQQAEVNSAHAPESLFEHQDKQLHSDNSMTLAAAVQAALARAPQRQLSETLAEVAQDQQQMSRRWISGQPRLNVYHRGDQLLDDTGIEETEIGLEFDLWRWGQKSAAKILTDDQQLLAGSGRDYVQWQVAGEVRSVLNQLLSDEVKVNHAEQAILDAEQLLQISEKRFRAGELPQRAVLQTEALLLDARQQRLQALARKADTERRYSMLTGLRRYPLQIVEPLPVALTINDQHPQLQYLLAQRQQLLTLEKQQRHQAGGNTTLSIGMRRERDFAGDEPVDSIGVGVSVPLGSSNYTRAASSAARLAAVEADIQLQQARRELQQQLHEAEHEFSLQKDGLDIAFRSAQLNQQQWQMQLKAFQLGESELQEVVLAQQHYQQSQLQLRLQQLQEQALHSYLKQVVGELP